MQKSIISNAIAFHGLLHSRDRRADKTLLEKLRMLKNALLILLLLLSIILRPPEGLLFLKRTV